MAPKDEKVFDAFVRVWLEWWSGVPDRLARQESSLVVRLLTLGLREGGIQQSELKRQLGIAQPRLSKLMVKLGKKKVGWIQVKAGTDRRVRLMTTTAAGETELAALKGDLAPLLRAQRARRTQAPALRPKPAPFRRGKRMREQPGQTKLLDANGDPVGLDSVIVDD